MNELWSGIVNSGLLLAVLAVAVAGIKCGVAWLNAKTQDITNGMKSQKVGNAIWRAEQAVSTAVLETAQMEADRYKAMGGGKLSDEQAAELKQLAIDRAKSFLTEDIINLLKENLGDVEAWFEGMTEQYVRQAKGGPA